MDGYRANSLGTEIRILTPGTWPYVYGPVYGGRLGLGAHPARVRKPEEHPPSHTAAPAVRAARECVLGKIENSSPPEFHEGPNPHHVISQAGGQSGRAPHQSPRTQASLASGLGVRVR